MKIKIQHSNFISKGLTLSLCLSIGTAFGIISSLGQSTLAQSVNSSQGTNYQNNEQNGLGGGTFGNSFNPLDLIHRSNLSRSRNMGEFDQDTQNNLTSEADKFKKLQQERLLRQEQLQTQPSAPATNPTPNN